MKCETSNRTSSYGVKPHIKKGYYPGKLLKVEEFTDKDGNPIVGKYGLQLIFEFAIYDKDQKTDKPIAPATFKADEHSEPTPVVIPKFCYHQYKFTEKGKQWVEGTYQTAITPNSAITGILQSLGWKFSEEPVEMDDFLNKWVELNIDDYVIGEGSDKRTVSTIKDINHYLGPEVGDVQKVEPSKEPANVKKQITTPVEEPSESGESDEIEKLKKNIANLDSLKSDGHLTEDGYVQAKEQLESQIEELSKK